MSMGLIWISNTPDTLSQRFSVAADKMEGKAVETVMKVVTGASDIMKANIKRGGENQTKKGGARILSGEMIGSVQGKIEMNARGRVVGQFGFSEATPEWTMYQERGTKHIAPMYAYVEAQVWARAAFPDEIERGSWFDVTTL